MATSAFLISVYLTIIRQLDVLLESVAGVDGTVFETAILLIALVLFQPVVSGLDLLLAQALSQFEQFTGVSEAPEEAMRVALEEAVRDRS